MIDIFLAKMKEYIEAKEMCDNYMSKDGEIPYLLGEKTTQIHDDLKELFIEAVGKAIYKPEEL